MQKIFLKWSDFETNIRESFKHLREVQDYFDVTLATDDGFTIGAHKIILSAGSQFFSNIFSQYKQKEQFIYMKGINRVELEYVVNFLYNGEAYVGQEELNEFLEIARELQVKGLQSKPMNLREERMTDNIDVYVESERDDIEIDNSEVTDQFYKQEPVFESRLLMIMISMLL